MEAPRRGVADIAAGRRRQRQNTRPKAPARIHGLALGGKKPCGQDLGQVAVPEKKGRSGRQHPHGDRRSVREDEIPKRPAVAVLAPPHRHEAQGHAARQAHKLPRGCCGEVLGRRKAMGRFRRIDAGQAHPPPVGKEHRVPVEDPGHDDRGLGRAVARQPEERAKDQDGKADRPAPPPVRAIRARSEKNEPAAAWAATAGCEIALVRHAT